MVWMPPVGGDEALGNGVCPACAPIERSAAMGQETCGTLRWGTGWSSVGEGRSANRARAQAHTAPHARRRRWCRANAAINGAPDHPREVQGSRHAAQSSTLGQRLSETPRSRGSYPPTGGGVPGSGELGAGVPATLARSDQGVTVLANHCEPTVRKPGLRADVPRLWGEGTSASAAAHPAHARQSPEHSVAPRRSQVRGEGL